MRSIMSMLVAGLIPLLIVGCVSKPLVDARTAYDAGLYSEAAIKSTEALEADDRSSEALYIRGMAAVELKDYTMGRELLAKASEFYKPNTEKGMALVKQQAKAEFYLQDFSAAQMRYKEYMAAKEAAGRLLLEDDYYWAGVIADVNLKDAERDSYWSKLSNAYKKEKGIK